MTPEVEAILKELLSLAQRKPLTGDSLKRAKELMSSLKRLDFTNKEVSELTDGNWALDTVKKYTRGAKTVDKAPKKRLTDLLCELVNRNIWMNQVEITLSRIKAIEAKGQNLENVLQFLSSIEESGVDLQNLIEVYQEITVSKLAVQDLRQALSYKKALSFPPKRENLNSPSKN